MKHLTVSFLAASLLLLSQTGCGKKEARTPAPAPSASQPKAATADAPAADAPPPPPPGAPTVPTATAEPTKEEAVDPNILQTVTYAMQSYVIHENHGPASLEEMVTKGYLKRLPEPPPGKKFVLDGAKLTISLVNQ